MRGFSIAQSRRFLLRVKYDTWLIRQAVECFYGEKGLFIIDKTCMRLLSLSTIVIPCDGDR